MCSHHSQWSTSSERSDTDKSSTSSVHGAHPKACSSDNPLLQSLIPSEVISPLEKKKRMAQASLTGSAIGTVDDGTELERPSVIHLSHSSQSPACPSSTRTRHSSDGSPLPVSSPSSSFSRSPSPYSVSSEDCIAVTTQKSPVKETESKTASRANTVPKSEASSAGVCKPLSCYPSSKDLTNYHRHHYREILAVGPAHSEKSQKGLGAWGLDGKSAARFAAFRLPSPASYNSKAYWIPQSSFSTVLPRSDPCRSLQPVYKPHMSYHQHSLKRPSTDDPYMRKMTVGPPFTITEKKDKTKTVLPKPLPTQQYFYHPHGSLAVPYLPERPRGDLTEQLKALPLQPVLFPNHLSIPSATQSMHCPPVATSFPGSYAATLPSYPYPLPLWHPPTGYSMAGLQPY